MSSKTSIQAGIQNSTGQRKSSELGYLTGALLLKSGTVWRPLRNREKLFGFHGVKVWSNIEMGNMERIPIIQTVLTSVFLFCNISEWIPPKFVERFDKNTEHT